jgi:hypothetical protein|tara:strand:- start:136 stop:465 length:330 start_codon:yes stop_codon:yes gene_type:complete
MAKVYVVQENPRVNILAAGRYGELIPLLSPGTQIALSPAPIVRLMKSKLKDYSDDDYLLAMGDPVAIGMACIVASEVNNGKVNILKWDRENSCYYNVAFNMYQKGESNV